MSNKTNSRTAPAVADDEALFVGTEAHPVRESLTPEAWAELQGWLKEAPTEPTPRMQAALARYKQRVLPNGA